MADDEQKDDRIEFIIAARVVGVDGRTREPYAKFQVSREEWAAMTLDDFTERYLKPAGAAVRNIINA